MKYMDTDKIMGRQLTDAESIAMLCDDLPDVPEGLIPKLTMTCPKCGSGGITDGLCHACGNNMLADFFILNKGEVDVYVDGKKLLRTFRKDRVRDGKPLETLQNRL